MNDEKTGPTSLAALTLLQLMQDLSEEYWAAGWRTDLEFMLWQLAQGDARGIGTPWDGSAEDGVVLRKLSDMCRGWWVWDGVELDVRFVPIAEWREMVANREGSAS